MTGFLSRKGTKRTRGSVRTAGPKGRLQGGARRSPTSDSYNNPSER